MTRPRTNASHYRQSTRAAREQQTWNRLGHARWAGDEPKQPSWPFAVAIAFIILVVLFGQFGA